MWFQSIKEEDVKQEEIRIMERVERFYPYIYQDKNEPFEIQMVGWTFLDYNRESPTSSFYIDLEQMEASFAIEYAIYWDYDIQHLYDLEHVIVYVDKEEKLKDVVLSYHGKFYRGTHTLKMEETHPIVYLQPGKHGIMSDPEYFHLYLDLMECCNKKAGCDGVLIAPMFKEKLTTTKKLNDKVEAYIKEKFSFIPSLNYVKAESVEKLLMPCEELLEQIFKRLQKFLEDFGE